MPSLQVPGAILNYEAFGSGPLLLLIPGADGRGAGFHEAAKHLAANFTAVCLTRRGFSKSILKGTQDFADRLSTDADDTCALIKHLSPVTGNAKVYGNSSGAIVAQRLLERHPEAVERLVSHEPPSLSILPEEMRLQATG